MKKFLAIALAAIMLFALAACGGNNATDGNATDGNATDGDAKAVLTMATNAEFPPYEYVDADKYYGIDVEVAKIIADKLGYDLVIENVAFDSIIPGVQAGKYDMGMAGMTVNEKRLESVDFSASYATGVQVVIVSENSKIQAIEDLDPYYAA